MLYIKDKFHVAVRLFSSRPQMTPKLVFLPHFDVFCDLLLDRPTASWNLLVSYSNIHIRASYHLTYRRSNYT